MAQSVDPSDPTLITGTLTVRNCKVNDGGAYSCEALNNQGFIFAVPDAIVNVINGLHFSLKIKTKLIDFVSSLGPSSPPAPCSCNGHSSYCSPDGRCLVNSIVLSVFYDRSCFCFIRTVNIIPLVLLVNTALQVIEETLAKVHHMIVN
jgi:hypothetical protein